MDSLPTVLVPGLATTALLYREQIPALWHFGPVMVANQTLHGSMSAIAADILANSPPRFALAGLSMGGYIAFEIMRQAPGRVSKLALLNTSARADTPEQTVRRKAQIEMLTNGKRREAFDLLFPLLVHPSRRTDVALKAIVEAMSLSMPPDAYRRQQMAIMGRPDSRSGLSAIKCPTLVLVGDGDQLTPPSLAQEIAAGIEGARLVTVPDCGHLSTLERPDIVTEHLMNWRSSV